MFLIDVTILLLSYNNNAKIPPIAIQSIGQAAQNFLQSHEYYLGDKNIPFNQK